MMAEKRQYLAVQRFGKLKNKTYTVKRSIKKTTIMKEGLKILTQAKQSTIFYYLYFNSP